MNESAVTQNNIADDTAPVKKAKGRTPKLTDSKHTPAQQTVSVGVGAVGCRLADGIREDNTEHQYLYVDTDRHTLSAFDEDEVLLIGVEETDGRGTGKRPDIGNRAAEDAEEAICAALADAQLALIIASFGGGTGAGAAPVIARIAGEQGRIAVMVAVDPFTFESSVKVQQAYEALRRVSDTAEAVVRIPCTVPTIPATADIRFREMFAAWEDYARCVISSLAKMIAGHEPLRLDFGDLRRVLSEPGGALIGIGKAEGENRVETAVRNACRASSLDVYHVHSAANVLLHVTGGPSLTLAEVEEGIRAISGLTADGDYLLHVSTDHELGDQVSVIILFSGFTYGSRQEKSAVAEQEHSVTRDAYVYEGINIDTPTFLRRPRNRYTRTNRYSTRGLNH